MVRDKVGNAVKNSLILNSLERFFNFVQAFLARCIFVDVLNAKNDEEILPKSITSTILNALLNIQHKITIPCNKFFKRSIILSFFTYLNNIFSKRSRIINAITNDTGFLAFLLILVISLVPFAHSKYLSCIIVAITGLAFLTRPLKIDLLSISFLLYSFVNIFVAIFISYSPRESLEIAVLLCVMMLAYHLIINLIDNERKFSIAMFIISISVLLTGIIGLLQNPTQMVNTTWVDKSNFSEMTLRVFSTFGNPNVYAGYLLMVMPLIFGMIFIAKTKKAKCFYFFTTMFLLLNFMLTYSRGSYIGLFVATLVFMFYMERRLIIVFAIGVLLMPFVLPDSVIERILSITDMSDTSNAFRMDTYRGSLRVMADYWSTGVGQGTSAYNTIYPLYMIEGTFSPHSHNLYLQTIIEIGIAGLLSFIFIIYAFFNKICTCKIKPTKSTRVMVGVFIAAMVGYLVHSLFDYTFAYDYYRLFFVFVCLIGLASAYINILNERAKNENY